MFLVELNRIDNFMTLLTWKRGTKQWIFLNQYVEEVFSYYLATEERMLKQSMLQTGFDNIRVDFCLEPYNCNNITVETLCMKQLSSRIQCLITGKGFIVSHLCFSSSIASSLLFIVFIAILCSSQVHSDSSKINTHGLHLQESTGMASNVIFSQLKVVRLHELEVL